MNKNLILLLLITLAGLFFYSYRLKETQLFRDDTARDTLKVLRIWQDKTITLIGPPISFTQTTTREAYLGSLFFYISIVGLMLVNWDPVGAVLPNTLLFTLSIPVFYLMVSKLTDSLWQKVAAAILYTFSPITVTHARFFWNPNLIIPTAVFFWYLVLKKTTEINTTINFFIAGVLGGVIFNFHYLAAVPLIIYIVTLFFVKQYLKFFSIVTGLVFGSLPIIIFEIRNNFYLTYALYQNLQQGRGPTSVNLVDGIYYFFNIFWSIFGLKNAEIEFPVTFISAILTDQFLIMITLVFIGAAIIRKISNEKINLFWPMMIITILMTVYFSFGNPLRFRYLFSIYPIMIWLVVYFIWKLRASFLIALFLPVIITSITIITDQPNLKKSFISLFLIESICKSIVQDNPEGNYNITENLKGDARAMSFRYCLVKGAKYKPQDEFSYNNLTSLYVISPTLDKIYEDNRWEFYASEPWRLVKTLEFDEVKLFKFVK